MKFQMEEGIPYALPALTVLRCFTASILEKCWCRSITASARTRLAAERKKNCIVVMLGAVQLMVTNFIPKPKNAHPVRFGFTFVFLIPEFLDVLLNAADAINNVLVDSPANCTRQGRPWIQLDWSYLNQTRHRYQNNSAPCRIGANRHLCKFN